MVTALVATNSRKLGDVSLLLGFVGGLFLAWASGAFLRGSESAADRTRERVRSLIGALLIAAAFLLLFVVRVFLH